MAEKATARTIHATRYRSTTAGEELADRESDRQTPPIRNDEIAATNAHRIVRLRGRRVPGIRRAAPMPQRYSEKQLVDRVRGR